MASPIVPLAAGIAVAAALAYLFKDKIFGRKSLVDQAQSMVEETADAAADAAETVADKVSKVAKDVKNSVT